MLSRRFCKEKKIQPNCTVKKNLFQDRISLTPDFTIKTNALRLRLECFVVLLTGATDFFSWHHRARVTREYFKSHAIFHSIMNIPYTLACR